MRRRDGAAPVAAALVVLALVGPQACGKDSTGPEAQRGQLTVEVQTSGSGGAAFLVTVTGDSIANPVAANASHRIDSFVSGRTMKAAVIGSVSSGPLLRFTVPDVNRSSQYSVTLNQVAGSDNALQATATYTLTITK